jgi:hypothetical protein
MYKSLIKLKYYWLDINQPINAIELQKYNRIKGENHWFVCFGWYCLNLDGFLEMDFSSYLISEALNFNARLLYEIYSHKANQR